MIQICDDYLAKQLMQVFDNALSDSVFPDIWKMVKVIPENI